MLHRRGLYYSMALMCGVMALALIAGCGTGGNGAEGNQRFYIADTGNSRIVRVDDFSGTNWITFGTLGTAASGADYLDRPTGIAFDSANNIYIVDAGNNRIVRMSDFSGDNWTTFGTQGFATNQFNHPSQIALDSSNNVYVTDTGNNRVVMFNASTTSNFNSGYGWITLGTVGNGINQFNDPSGIYIDSSNRIYIADTSNNRIVRINNITGAGWTALGSLGSGNGNFNSPSGISQDAQGLYYVTDSGNNRIVRFSDLTGTGWTNVGAGLGVNLNDFNYPTGIAVYNYVTSSTPTKITTTPYIYIVDTGNSRVIRYVNITDTSPLVIGLPGADIYELSSPQGIVVHQ